MMATQDHYAALGLEPGASPDMIKAAYRRLARENHPDLNPEDAAAAERFRRAVDAYRALTSTPVSPESTEGPSHSPKKGTSEVFEAVFGRRRRSKRERGADLRYTLRLEFLEAAKGGDRTIRVPGKATCKRCGGTGAELGSTPILCWRCKGEGRIPKSVGFFERFEDCPECRGRGIIFSDPCRLCKGEGQVEVEREIPLVLPPGVSDGTRLRVAGEGQPGLGGAEAGDLFVVIQVAPHPFFRREGQDLVVEVPVPFPLAALGGHVRLPTLDGVVRMRVPPGSRSGRVFRLKGKGFDGGDQRITLVVETPENLPSAARQALEAYAELEREQHLLPQVEAFSKEVDAYDRNSG